MKIRPIKPEAHYVATLEGIERLFDAAPDASEGNRLEMLTQPYDYKQAT